VRATSRSYARRTHLAARPARSKHAGALVGVVVVVAAAVVAVVDTVASALVAVAMAAPADNKSFDYRALLRQPCA